MPLKSSNARPHPRPLHQNGGQCFLKLPGESSEQPRLRIPGPELELWMSQLQPTDARATPSQLQSPHLQKPRTVRTPSRSWKADEEGDL